jgi:hypothetical protein
LQELVVRQQQLLQLEPQGLLVHLVWEGQLLQQMVGLLLVGLKELATPPQQQQQQRGMLG